MFDTDETVGDQMLLEVLDESSDIKMKSIVTTIQKEQNKIIRDTQSDLLFVQGLRVLGKRPLCCNGSLICFTGTAEI